MVREMAVQVDETEPLNFSKVNLKHPMTAITKQFPKFPADGPCQECVVEEGCMLYLPAGEFRASNLLVVYKPLNALCIYTTLYTEYINVNKNSVTSPNFFTC